MGAVEIRKGSVVRGPMLPEPIEVVHTVVMGASIQLMGKGLQSGKFYDPILSADAMSQLSVSAERPPFDGDAKVFRLGVEAHRLGLAYEYDPYFSLSIARVDPLPHQLEAVYHYFLKIPRIRFLLADDPGAGKTIMAGLLLKELKARGLVKRVLIVTPANLTFQWCRELKDKFRESFARLDGAVLRTNYGQNPFAEPNAQIVTSVSWVSTVEDAQESLLRAPRWDLVIVDEAHKMAAYADRKTLAYELGERLSENTDHFLLMTATPHKGDAENFCRFLALLDKDVYGNIESLEEAMRRHEAPFYLRRRKEVLVSFPDEDGVVKKLFTERDVRTAAFQLDGDELEFYEDLTRYVEDQSVIAAGDNSVRGRAIGFTMAMLQRRMASTVYAVRRTLDRMVKKRETILADPAAYRRELVEKAAAREHDDLDDLSDEEREELLAKYEDVVASVDPAALREEITRLRKLIGQARQLEARAVESKLTKLRALLEQEGIFKNPTMKLLVFTEHKDSLDFLAGDGRDGRPMGKLREWGLTVTQIHGGMKIGDRDTAGTRLHAEREFREGAQVLVATEAAGEGINLQFCWFLVNYDIPWNPVRLEQRLGRIHRYGQEKNCLIFNFVASNTREGRVLAKLHERLREIRAELGTDQVFDVVGEVLPAQTIERLFRDMYRRALDEDAVASRIVREVDTGRFRRITESRIEMLAKRELNMSAIIGRSIEAKEARLVPEAIEQFFLEAGPNSGLKPKHLGGRVYMIGKVPRPLLAIGDRLEAKFGRLGRDYKSVVFDKVLLKSDATLEWVTPGHPLFESVRDEAIVRAGPHFEKGAVFYDLHRTAPAVYDVFAASIQDGTGRTLHRRLFIIETGPSGQMLVRQPTALLDVSAAPPGTTAPDLPVPPPDVVKAFLHGTELQPWCNRIAAERRQEVGTVEHHVKVSLNALIHRDQEALAEYHTKHADSGRDLAQDIKVRELELHLDELNNRLDRRLLELVGERNAHVADVQLLGRAWVLPHPERGNPSLSPMVRDEVIERLAVEVATRYLVDQGFKVESVELDNRGYDLIARGRPHPEDPNTYTLVLFVEVKGRSARGDIALTTNEYRAAERLKDDYWLFAVFDCASDQPCLERVQNPARLGWQPVTKVEHYRLGGPAVSAASEKTPS